MKPLFDTTDGHRLKIAAPLRPVLLLTVAGLVVLTGGCAIAAAGSTTGASAAGRSAVIAWPNLLMQLFGGLALFLFGMDQMAQGLKNVAGDRMKDVLRRLTGTPISGALTGAGVTVFIQSSSVTTVLIVGFVTAGIMNLQQSVGVIMGANIGTTVTAQIMAFKVEKAALLLIAFGFAGLFFGKRADVRNYGNLIMGLGLIFFGMGIMSDAIAPLRTHEPFIRFMAGMDNPVTGILAAAAFTALVQSSSATTGIVITLAAQGLITLEAGIALAFGANIGTCITAMLACLGKPVEAIRAAAVHVFFNVAGVLLWIALIPFLASVVVSFSPTYPDLSGTARLAAETPRQIANAHTIFNAANTLIFIGFAGWIARLVERWVPARSREIPEADRPRFLDPGVLDAPAGALEMIRKEIGRTESMITEMLDTLADLRNNDRAASFETLRALERRVDRLEDAIIAYASKLQSTPLSDAMTHDLHKLIKAVDNIESAADVLGRDFIDILSKLSDANIEVSQETKDRFLAIFEEVRETFAASVQAVVESDVDAAQRVLETKGTIHDRIEDSLRYLIVKMGEATGERDAFKFRLEMEAIDRLKHLYALSKRIAKSEIGVMSAPAEEAPGG